MWTIDEAWRPSERRSLFADTPFALLGFLGAVALGASVLRGLVELPVGVLGAVGAAVGHGALLATALAWAGVGRRAHLAAVGLLGVAGAAASLHPAGAHAYLGVPVFLFLRARRGELRGLGLGDPVGWGAALAGVSVGAFLGAHLLVSASRTLSVRVGTGSLAGLLAAAAYDVGANVPATEAFFRGALFNRAQRRWSLPTAAALSTAGCVARYLLDPLLPKSLELLVGAVFYMTLLSATSCWFFWRSGSLLPGALSSLVFFVAYRLVSPA